MKATCPYCGEDWILRRDGSLRRHRDNFAGTECQGSCKPPALPKQHIHHCPCGAAWDEFKDEFAS